MYYVSTRGNTPKMQFSDVLLMGLAPDGGLMLPEYYPNIDDKTLTKWRSLNYQELAFEIMQLFATDIDKDDLKKLIDKTYTKDVFGSDDITPVDKLYHDIYLLKLSNGPTLAFKDIAMQFLGNAFEYVLNQKNQRLTIIGATSGDTGSAAEYALKGKKNIEVFEVFPNIASGKFNGYQNVSITHKELREIVSKNERISARSNVQSRR